MLGLSSAMAGAMGAVCAFASGFLPALAWCVCACAVGLLGMAWAPRARWLAAFVLGVAWTCLCGGFAMRERLPHALEGRDLAVEFRVSGLPKRAAGAVRFDAVFDAGVDGVRGRTVRLAWYDAAVDPAPGSRWHGHVRLKRPRGTVNPGGFDFERHALERGIAATGYVRDARSLDATKATSLGSRLRGSDVAARRSREGGNPGAMRGEVSHLGSRLRGSDVDARHLREGGNPATFAAPRGFAGAIDRVRDRLSRAIGASTTTARDARFVQALAIGDTRALTERDWDVLRATGIAHLIAISGLHVGLVAGFGALLMRGAHRVVPRLGLRLPLPQSAALGALAWAGAYTALAGFALPTVRTLLMIAAALLGTLLRRPTRASQAFALSLMAVLIADPLALLGAGFWLSFVGVAWLLWCLPREGALRAWRALLSAQAVMTVSLVPLGAWFFGQASIVGPFANLVAVPWVSFVVVPVALIGVALELVASGAGHAPFAAAAWLMDVLWRALEPASHWRFAIAWLPEATPLAFVLASASAFWLLLPRGLPGKALALFLFLPLAWPARDLPHAGEADVMLIDVGQGLSVLVRTRSHALLYDAGPALAGGLDHGDATVVPALRALGVRTLDAYVESHGHNDHAGGTAAVVRAFAPRVFASDLRRDAVDTREDASDPRRSARESRRSTNDPHRNASPCRGAWTWDAVRFEFLHPPAHFPYLDNDSSCVLRVRGLGATLLLPGDISATIEERLLREHADLRADAIVVPHHGSRTSSSPAFVQATTPRVALIGSGHGNRFGLPRRDIVQRWRTQGANVLATADHGAISLRLGTTGIGTVRPRRDYPPRWWREDGVPGW